MDFGSLPPEVNSGRLYAGPGPSPMLAAAAAWDIVAAELDTMATAYSTICATLAGSWRGPSFMAMVAAAEPYTRWLHASACTAQQTATRARAAAAAYELAFETTVPPAIIADNRSLLVSLIATNLFGQNTPAIAAVELDYARMWAQDALAMYMYANSSSAACAVTPFSTPPQTTNLFGVVAQATQSVQTNARTLSAWLSTVPPLLHNMAAPMLSASEATATPSLSSILLNLTIGSLSPLNLASAPGGGELFGLLMYSVAQTGVNFGKVFGVFTEFMGTSATNGSGLGSTLASSTTPAQVSVSMRHAALVGAMSVPPSWVAAAPGIAPAGVLLPVSNPAAAVAAVTAVETGGLFGGMALSGLAGRALAATRDRAALAGTIPRRGTATAAPDVATVNIILITEDD